MAVVRSVVTVVARATVSMATTARYHSNGRGGNKNDSKGNSDKNGERGGNNGGSASHLCLIFYFFCQDHDKVTKFIFLLDT